MRGRDRTPLLQCTACSKPIRNARAVVYRHGDMHHLDCIAKATRLRSKELYERTAKNIAEAIALLERLSAPPRRSNAGPAPGRRTRRPGGPARASGSRGSSKRRA